MSQRAKPWWNESVHYQSPAPIPTLEAECPTCHGDGFLEVPLQEEMFDCPGCHGSGIVRVPAVPERGGGGSSGEGV